MTTTLWFLLEKQLANSLHIVLFRVKLSSTQPFFDCPIGSYEAPRCNLLRLLFLQAKSEYGILLFHIEIINRKNASTIAAFFNTRDLLKIDDIIPGVRD
jgi:hypothetical protein